MLSLGKLLLLAAAIAAVWFGFRWWQGYQLRAAQRAAAPPPPKSRVQDMRPCRVCGVYLAPGARACERPDCPQRGAA